MTDLALELAVSRELDCDDTITLDTALAGKRIVVVGASHAMRLASALEDLGVIVIDISVPGWKVSSEAVEDMKKELSTVLEEEFEGDTIILYQLFDNNMYLACDAEGNRSLPVKQADSKYHVPGRLVFIDRDSFKELFLKVLPLLRAGLQHTKILLTPLMRFVKSSCCNNSSHMTNRRERNLAKLMGEAIGEVKEWLQDFTFTRRIRNFAILCPNTLLQGENEVEDGAAMIKKFWDSGPVHMNQDGYSALASNLVNSLAEVKVARPTEKRGSAAAAKVPDRAAMRESWVQDNDSSVHRQYEGESSRGRFNWRGGWRGHGNYRGRGGRGSKKFFTKRSKPY
jgi:hypothetical protein